MEHWITIIYTYGFYIYSFFIMAELILYPIIEFFYKILTLIIENFNFAWLFLIIFFFLRHELTLLLLSITKFRYGEYSIEVNLQTSRKTMEYINNKLENKYGEVYKNVHTKNSISGPVGFGAGKLREDETLENRGLISLYANVLLEDSFEKYGSVETIISMYNIFVESYLGENKLLYSLTSDEVLSDKSKEEINIVKNIQRIYVETINNKEIVDFWRFGDILMYRNILLMALKIKNENFINN